MTNEEKENGINQLLVFMNNELEEHGAPSLKNLQFNFLENGDDALRFIEKHQLPYNDLLIIIKICTTRQYIQGVTHGYNYVTITEEGQGRAISYINADKNKNSSSEQVVIGTLNANAPTQIGNNNIQNIENVLTQLVEQIENSSASDEEKQAAKSKIKDLLDHPLINTLIGSTLSSLPQLLGG